MQHDEVDDALISKERKEVAIYSAQRVRLVPCHGDKIESFEDI